MKILVLLSLLTIELRADFINGEIGYRPYLTETTEDFQVLKFPFFGVGNCFITYNCVGTPFARNVTTDLCENSSGNSFYYSTLRVCHNNVY
ncbi:MAG: hypothetical protein AB7O96_13495 [Pseudobdellovibrionaceae bacterium]